MNRSHASPGGDEHGSMPLAVWPCAPTPHQAGTPLIPVLLLQRLIAVYSHPGALVLAAGPDASRIAEIAAELDRAAVIDPADHPRPFPPLGTRRAALVIATGAAVTTDPARYARWARALTPGGVLTTATPAAPGTAALLPGRVVTAARTAGLTYLQHVVAVRARLVGDRLVAYPCREDLAQADAAATTGLRVHLPAHTDVLVFIRDAGHPAPTAAVEAQHAA